MGRNFYPTLVIAAGFIWSAAPAWAEGRPAAVPLVDQAVRLILDGSLDRPPVALEDSAAGQVDKLLPARHKDIDGVLILGGAAAQPL